MARGSAAESSSGIHCPKLSVLCAAVAFSRLVNELVVCGEGDIA
jgi:hypothetical protein